MTRKAKQRSAPARSSAQSGPSAASETVSQVDPRVLVDHPLQARVYGDSADEGLVESIRREGVITPLIATLREGQHVLVAGHRRRDAALRLGLEKVPVILRAFDDELAMDVAVIESNRQREKTNAQRVSEGQALGRVFAAQARRRQAHVDRSVPVGGRGRKSPGTAGPGVSEHRRTRQRIAEAIGLGSGKAYERLRKANDLAPEVVEANPAARPAQLLRLAQERVAGQRTSGAGHARPKAGKSPTKWQRVRETLESAVAQLQEVAFACPGGPSLNETLRHIELEQVIGTFRADITFALAYAAHCVKKHGAPDRKVQRDRILEACKELSMNPPRPGQPIDLKLVKMQWRRLVHLCHPDKNSSAEKDSADFHELVEARQVCEEYARQYGAKEAG